MLMICHPKRMNDEQNNIDADKTPVSHMLSMNDFTNLQRKN